MSINVTSSISGIVRHVIGYQNAGAIDREIELPNLTIMVRGIIDQLQSVWHIISQHVTEFEVLAESLLESNESDLLELGKAISFLVSLLLFHMESYEEACEWAVQAGHYVHSILGSENGGSIGLCGEAYRQLLSTRLVDKYVEADLNEKQRLTIEEFMTAMVQTTIEQAQSQITANPESEQKNACVVVFGLAHRTATISWLEDLIFAFPKNLLLLLRIAIRLPKECVPFGAAPTHINSKRESFRIEAIKRLVLATVIGCEFDEQFVFLPGIPGGCKQPICTSDYSVVAGMCRKLSAPTQEERQELTVANNVDQEDQESFWERHFNMVGRAINSMQPIFDIWDGLVRLGDCERLHQLLLCLFCGKFVSNKDASIFIPEARQVVIQLCLDLAAYYPQLAKKVKAGIQGCSQGPSSCSLKRLIYCLSGRVNMHLRLEIMSRKNMVDMKLLEQLRVTADGRESLTHQGLMLCHGLSTAFVTSDAFLRNNVDWYKKAICWAKFAGASTLGVTHRGHVENSKSSGQPRSLTILKNYLPRTPGVLDDGSDFEGLGSGASYSEGGGLYALGLIHAGAMYPLAKRIAHYHLTEIPAADDEGTIKSTPVHHGAALALGLICLGEQDSDAQNAFLEALHKDNSVIGEACAYGLGLNAASSFDRDLIDLMIEDARETSHEKIKRSLSTSVAMLCIERQAQAEPIINELLSAYNAWIRIGGVWVIATAYVGTSNPQKVKQLLDLTIYDTNDDIRRTAAIALAFVCCNDQEILCDNVSLLLENYQPHLRYGSALAIGIGCAGSGRGRAISLLRPLTEDPVAFVRHAAHLALGLVISNVPERSVPHNKIDSIHKDLIKVARSKTRLDEREEGLVRFGAFLGIGFANAGGGNAKVSLMTTVPRGSAGDISVVDHNAVCGLLLFANYWYWYPLVNMVIIAMTSQLHVVLNHRLQAPSDYVIFDSTEEGTFAYTDPVPEVPARKKRKAAHSHARKMITRRPVPLKNIENGSGTPETDYKNDEETEAKGTDNAETGNVDDEEEEEIPLTNDIQGHYIEIPARMSDYRAEFCSSGFSGLIKSPAAKNVESIVNGKKAPAMVCGLKRTDGKVHCRYIPINNRRYQGNVVVVDRFIEVSRMPVITNVTVAFETKPKRDDKKDKERRVREGDSAAEAGETNPAEEVETAPEGDLPGEDQTEAAEPVDDVEFEGKKGEEREGMGEVDAPDTEKG